MSISQKKKILFRNRLSHTDITEYSVAHHTLYYHNQNILYSHEHNAYNIAK